MSTVTTWTFVATLIGVPLASFVLLLKAGRSWWSALYGAGIAWACAFGIFVGLMLWADRNGIGFDPIAEPAVWIMVVAVAWGVWRVWKMARST
jgi:hypothetical protein